MSDENTMDPNTGGTPAEDQNTEQSTPEVTPDATPTGEVEGDTPATEETPAM